MKRVSENLYDTPTASIAANTVDPTVSQERFIPEDAKDIGVEGVASILAAEPEDNAVFNIATSRDGTDWSTNKVQHRVSLDTAVATSPSGGVFTPMDSLRGRWVRVDSIENEADSNAITVPNLVVSYLV